jgi:hypothetical protein
MGRFFQRFLKKQERGPEHYIDQAQSYYCSLTLGRAFGETIESYIARSPSVADSIQECKEDIYLLECIAGNLTIEDLYKEEHNAYNKSAFSLSLQLRKVIEIRCNKEGLRMWIDRFPYAPISKPRSDSQGVWCKAL